MVRGEGIKEDRDRILSINKSPSFQKKGGHCAMTILACVVEWSAAIFLKNRSQRAERVVQTVSRASILAPFSRRMEATALSPFRDAQ
jgi:hypothetical protein